MVCSSSLTFPIPPSNPSQEVSPLPVSPTRTFGCSIRSPLKLIHSTLALFQTMLQLGGAFGLAITAVINTSYRDKALDRGVEKVAATLTGLHSAFWLAAGCSFSALILAMVALRGMGTIGRGSKGSKEAERTEQRDPGVDDEENVDVKAAGGKAREGGEV